MNVTPGLTWRTLPAARGVDGGHVDLFQGHHGRECALCLGADCSHGIGERARGDLPRQSPAVLAPATGAFLSAIADDRIPVAVGLFLIVRGDLEGERLALLELRAAVETEAGNPENG